MNLFSEKINVFDFLNIVNILYVKSTEDVLQGISKLDYLLKVSVFQIYKNPDANRQFSIVSDSDQSDEEESEEFRR